MQKESSKVARNAHTSVRLPKNIKKALDSDAKANRRSRSQELIHILESHYSAWLKKS
jgi:predicted transcriptional regulator